MFVRIIDVCKQQIFVDFVVIIQTLTQQCGNVAMLCAELSF